MSPRDKVQLGSIAQLAEEVIHEIEQAKREVRALRNAETVGGLLWCALDAIEDRLHEALTKLGG